MEQAQGLEHGERIALLFQAKEKPTATFEQLCWRATGWHQQGKVAERMVEKRMVGS